MAKKQDKATLESISLEQLDAVVRNNVCISMHEADPKLRGMKLFSDYKTLLRQKNWDCIIKDNTEIAVQHVVNLLKPKELQDKVQNDLSLSKKSLTKDWKKLYKYIIKQIVACEAFVPANKSTKKALEE